METLTLVRHGESEFSMRASVNGDVAVACPLTERGVEQARRLAEELAVESIDLCVTSEFERTRQTAELVLAGRDVPRLVLSELNDPRVGRFEGGPLAEYRAWAHAQGSSSEPPGGGESRLSIARRYAAGFGEVLGRPERSVLAVIHALPIAYLLAASEGIPPAARMDRAIDYAVPYRLSADAARRAVERIESWCAAPTW